MGSRSEVMAERTVVPLAGRLWRACYIARHSTSSNVPLQQARASFSRCRGHEKNLDSVGVDPKENTCGRDLEGDSALTRRYEQQRMVEQFCREPSLL